MNIPEIQEAAVTGYRLTSCFTYFCLIRKSFYVIFCLRKNLLRKELANIGCGAIDGCSEVTNFPSSCLDGVPALAGDIPVTTGRDFFTMIKDIIHVFTSSFSCT